MLSRVLFVLVISGAIGTAFTVSRPLSPRAIGSSGYQNARGAGSLFIEVADKVTELHLGASRLAFYSAPTPNSAPCTSNVVTNYGADPTGNTDSTVAFQEALNATPQPASSAAPGNIVCVPPGVYVIGSPSPAGPHDLEILSPASINGGALIGPNHGVAEIVQMDPTTYIFSSCETQPLSAPNMAEPTGCPGAMDSNVVNNWRIQNITLSYSVQVPVPTPGATSGPLNGWGPSAVYFPKVNGLEMHNVLIRNAWNCYDFGSQVGASISRVAIVESTGFSTCAGHLAALHGGGGGLEVIRQHVQGGRGVADYPFEGVMFDTTDAGFGTGGVTLTDYSFLENDWENAAWGTVGLVSDSLVFGDYTANGNSCNNLTFGCYYFFSVPNQTKFGSTSHITIYDQLGQSWYSPLQFDGGSYARGGVDSIQVQGGNYIGGAGPSGVGGASVLWVGGATSGGFSTDGSALGVQFQPTPPATFSPWYVTTAAPGDTPRTITDRFVSQYGCTRSPTLCATPIAISSPPPVNIGTTYMGSPNYAPIEMYEHSPPPSGVYVDMPYKVQTTGTFTVVSQQTAPPAGKCTPPPQMQLAGFNTTPSPCWTGFFDQGDGAAFRNGAHDIQIAGAKLRSVGQASVDFTSAGDEVRIFGNVLGYFGGAATYNCVNVGSAANPNLHVESNDCTGAADTTAPIVYYTPYPAASAGYYPVIRNNRGTTGVIVGPTSGPTFTNVGPFDCTYYFNWNGTTVSSLTLSYPLASPTSLPTPPAVSIFMPVGASLAATFSGTVPTYTGFCTE